MYERIPVSEARDRFREIVSRSAFGKETTILTFRGKDIAAVVPLTDVKAGNDRKMPSAAKKVSKIKSA